MGEKEIDELSSFFRALSDPTRLKLVRILSAKPFLCVNALASRLGVSQSAVSQHLRVLRQCGLVMAERRGYYVHYGLNRGAMEKYAKLMPEVLGTKNP